MFPSWALAILTYLWLLFSHKNNSQSKTIKMFYWFTNLRANSDWFCGTFPKKHLAHLSYYNSTLYSTEHCYTVWDTHAEQSCFFMNGKVRTEDFRSMNGAQSSLRSCSKSVVCPNHWMHATVYPKLVLCYLVFLLLLSKACLWLYFTIFYADCSNSLCYPLSSVEAFAWTFTAKSFIPNVQLQSQSDSNIQQKRDYELSRGSKMFGWIRTSHGAQVQSPAALGLGQVEVTLEHSMLTMWNRFLTLYAKHTSGRQYTFHS